MQAQVGLIVTPRICGICGGSHLYKACYALDTAWRTHVPRNGTLIRNVAQCCETLQSIPRWFYALFAIFGGQWPHSSFRIPGA